MNKKRGFVIFILGIFLLSSFTVVSAGFFGELFNKNKVTGKWENIVL